MIADVSRETAARLELLQRLIVAEADHQNLVSRSSIADFHTRHVEDSLQLLPLLPSGALLDIGSGAGLPGLVLACARHGDAPVHLVEPRAKRAAFLADAAERLGLGAHVHVHRSTVERLALLPVAAITARAVASLPDIFAMAHHLSDEKTRWILPKGRSASTELEAARRSWQGDFALVPSITDPDAAIVTASAVRRRVSR